MQRSWLRALVCAFVIVAAVVAAGTNAFAAPDAHPCAGMSITDARHSDHGGHAPVPRRCDSLICGAVHAPPVVVVGEAAAIHISRAPKPRDDDARLDATGPPDLRPPIT
ncbi:MAG: hypothetical protein ACR652_21750 [Methylocystis sp.]|uniref:hypothetical protein n=1 Tax=Methylocystis sp. TaxID=1911079 RepID=UPI003DA5273D